MPVPQFAKHDHKNFGASIQTQSKEALIPRNKMFTSATQNCKARLSTIVALAIIGFILLSVLMIALNPPPRAVNVLLIQKDVPITHVTSTKFLSLALDSSMIAEGFVKFDMRNKKLRNMMRNLAPGYLRIGGTMADRLIFVQDNSHLTKVFSLEQDGSACAYEGEQCSLELRPNFTLSGVEWLELYDLAYSTGFTILFDLNALVRNPDGSWNYENAEELINFSNDNNMDVIWQLGNEPNIFENIFNYTVNATQLAKDFTMLRGILEKYPMYENATLVGPDVTRPRPEETSSINYLRDFLASGAGHVINAITFHQYYFNGRTATHQDFLDPHVYDLFVAQTDLVKSIVSYYDEDTKEIWLTETSDAYGGGAPGYSNRYIGTFIWLDKLGVAAKMGLHIVVRQTLFKGFYALVDNSYTPTPNYWISAVYKAFVGPEVVPCIGATSDQVRMYCQCSNKNFKASHITIFGSNLKDTDAIIRVEGLKDPRHAMGTIYAYILSPYLTILSKGIYLNKEPLVLGPEGELPPFKPKLITDEVHVVIPPYSSGFFVIPTDISGCQ